MKILTSDGAVFDAKTAAGIVAAMRKDDWGAPPKKLEYMVETAERVEMITGSVIRTSNPVDFLIDLERAGFCHIENLTPKQAAEFADAGTGSTVANIHLPDEEVSL